MAGKKGKQQFQGAGRRFRGDIWLDQKVSGRTMAELQSRGIKFPAGVNVRQTQEFNVSSICSVSSTPRRSRQKKKPQRQRRQQPSSPQPKKLLHYK